MDRWPLPGNPDRQLAFSAEWEFLLLEHTGVGCAHSALTLGHLLVSGPQGL